MKNNSKFTQKVNVKEFMTNTSTRAGMNRANFINKNKAMAADGSENTTRGGGTGAAEDPKAVLPHGLGDRQSMGQTYRVNQSRQ